MILWYIFVLNVPGIRGTQVCGLSLSGTQEKIAQINYEVVCLVGWICTGVLMFSGFPEDILWSEWFMHDSCRRRPRDHQASSHESPNEILIKLYHNRTN